MEEVKNEQQVNEVVEVEVKESKFKKLFSKRNMTIAGGVFVAGALGILGYALGKGNSEEEVKEDYLPEPSYDTLKEVAVDTDYSEVIEDEQEES